VAASNRDGHALEALRIGTIAVCCWTANRHPYGPAIRQHQDGRSAASRRMLKGGYPVLHSCASMPADAAQSTSTIMPS
jgi:hypothetical protein